MVGRLTREKFKRNQKELKDKMTSGRRSGYGPWGLGIYVWATMPARPKAYLAEDVTENDEEPIGSLPGNFLSSTADAAAVASVEARPADPCVEPKGFPPVPSISLPITNTTKSLKQAAAATPLPMPALSLTWIKRRGTILARSSVFGA